MGKIRALAVASALVGGLAVIANAAPAQADTLRNVYYSSSDCYRYGDYGVQNHLWTWYHCDYQYNFWFLYSVP
ncbi:hypothetical protein GCM10011574_12510 [Microbispora bryophytorum]|uniref:Secreted protein n=1 Tax=Microbispora bryophytorum TaxID=1460882 RepID=A0A8H9GVI4_9ACTN|nr:hypothetical protein [Microbispora bryophytorum]GGO03057.1 hypothetical protein GCM10011574_12510 [Microbispora bryophytorum]